MQLVHGAGGVTDNGIAVQSDSILFNYDPFIGNEQTEFGVIASVADLGQLVASNGASDNAANAISALQGADSEGLINLYNSNSALYDTIYDADVTGLSLLAEQLVSGNPSNSIAATQNAQNEATNTLLNRVAELRSGASGVSAGDHDTDSPIRPDSLWLRAIYSDGDQQASAGFSSYRLKSKGFTLGADRDVSDFLTLGLGMTLVNSSANLTGSGPAGNNSDTESYLASLYAGWRHQDYFVDTTMSLGVSQSDLQGSGWQTQYDSRQVALSLLAGKSFLFNNNDSLIEPTLGFNYTRLSSDGYSYDAMQVEDSRLQALELGGGIRFITSMDLGSGQLLPEASLMAWHDVKAEAVETGIGFENSGESFTYFGPEAVKNRYQASIGAEYWMDNNITLSLNYDHNWQSGFKANTVQAKFRYDF